MSTDPELMDSGHPSSVRGIEFIEYATARPLALGHVLELMGFQPIPDEQRFGIRPEGRILCSPCRSFYLQLIALEPGPPAQAEERLSRLGLGTGDVVDAGDFSFEVFNDDYVQLQPSFVAARARRAAEWLGEDVLQRPVPLPTELPRAAIARLP